MPDASSALGTQQVAGGPVNRRGKAKRGMGTLAGAQIGGVVGAAMAAGISGNGGSPQPTPETPDFGAFGYLAVSATDLVMVRGKQGLTGLKMTDDVVAKVPRGDVISADLGKGTIACPTGSCSLPPMTASSLVRAPCGNAAPIRRRVRPAGDRALVLRRGAGNPRSPPGAQRRARSRKTASTLWNTSSRASSLAWPWPAAASAAATNNSNESRSRFASLRMSSRSTSRPAGETDDNAETTAVRLRVQPDLLDEGGVARDGPKGLGDVLARLVKDYLDFGLHPSWVGALRPLLLPRV